MNWINIEDKKFYGFKPGTICRTEYGEFVLVGDINTSLGTNDEFTEDITHYTDDFVDVIADIVTKCKEDF